MTSRPNRLGSSRVLRKSSSIAVAMGAANVAAYALTILAAHVLGPRHYGAFAAVLNVLLVASVVTLALQATAARRIAREPEHVLEVEDTILVVGRLSGAGMGLVFLALSPLVAELLRLDSVLTAVALAIAIAPTALMGAQAGILQGERRWTPLAMQYLSAGLGRIVCGALGLLVRSDELGATVGVAVGSLVPVAVGWYALRRLRRDRRPGPRSGHAQRSRALDGDGLQLPGTTGVPGGLQRRPDHRPQHPRQPRRRSLRGRSDHGQGRPVPAPVRRRARLPLDGQRRCRHATCSSPACWSSSPSGLARRSGCAFSRAWR